MSQPEAGPSSLPSTSSKLAPSHPLPSRAFYSVEFPGYVRQSSVPQAIKHIGGQETLNRVFDANATKTNMLLELNWRPENPFSHPISGGVIASHGIVLKVVKKRRRKNEVDGMSGEQPQGEFTAEAVGIIPRTARFRSMADFQYMPDMEDPVVKLRLAMDAMDAQAICNYTIPPEKEDYNIPDEIENDELGTTQGTTAQSSALDHRRFSSPLRLLPPPLFSRQIVPHIYNYKQNTMSIVSTTVDEETNTEKKRLINRSRWAPSGPAQTSFSDQGVPMGPPESALESKNRANLNKRILGLLKERFDERPSWTRVALFNQFSSDDSRELSKYVIQARYFCSKMLLALACYTFMDGPWRDTLCRFGYDPRKDPDSRFYQRLYFRDTNRNVVRASVTVRRQENRSAISDSLFEKQQSNKEGGSSSASHIFDGIHLNRETAAFQLCDITDPMLKEMIEDEDAIRDECDERDGWFTTRSIERIKAVLRHKHFSLVDGIQASDEDCRALLERESTGAADENKRISHREPRHLRRGKHNMAKGAQRPEDALALRLRAKLDSSARGSGGTS